jgi:ketose-bisphosphate aldolase
MQRWPAEELKTPVIYGVHPVESANAGNQNMVALISSLVRSRNLVAGLHLDHSPSFDKVVEFIRDGYTSVMVEGSTLPLGQNLQLTRDAVRVARPAGVSVEAEVGTIGTTAEYGAEIENPHLADPAGCEAMGETGIDALAVAIGNAHGFYIAEPKLDLDLLGKVRRRIEVPLVLNGGSGIPVDQVQKAIGMGVAKMNVGTAIHVAFKERMEQGLANPGSHDIMKIVSGCQPRVRDVQRQYVDITMSAGRAA